MTDEAIALLAPRIGTRAACAAAGVPQASWYRRHRISPPPQRPVPVPHAERVQPRALAGLKQPQGRPAADPRDAQIARLRKEKATLEQELAKARFVVDVQSKLQALLETISEGADIEPGSSS